MRTFEKMSKKELETNYIVYGVFRDFHHKMRNHKQVEKCESLMFRVKLMLWAKFLEQI